MQIELAGARGFLAQQHGKATSVDGAIDVDVGIAYEPDIGAPADSTACQRQIDRRHGGLVLDRVGRTHHSEETGRACC